MSNFSGDHRLFEEALKNTPESSKRFAKNSLDIIDTVHEILNGKGLTQKDLADKLGKSESEVSKWLTSLHNLTLKSITKLEAALGEDIIITTNQINIQSVEVRRATFTSMQFEKIFISKTSLYKNNFSSTDFEDIIPSELEKSYLLNA
ncbi:MAG: helix-turn-helix transcriptional regulator, partial [Bacteroidota bacterium]